MGHEAGGVVMIMENAPDDLDDPEMAALVRQFGFDLRRENGPLPGPDLAKMHAAVAAFERTRAVDKPRLAPARRTWPWVAAAAALVACMVAYLFTQRLSADPDAALVVAAQDLARAHPQLFTGFAPLGAHERRPSGPHRSSGFALLRPVRVVLDSPQTYAWEEVAGAEEYQLAVLPRAGGVALLQSVTTHPELEAPASTVLPPGEYTWRVTCEDATGRYRSAEAGFVVASPAEAARVRAMAAAATTAPTELRDVLIAHVLLRAQCLNAAETTLRAALEAAPRDQVAWESLAYVLDAIGAREATATWQRAGERR
jgi:hypothetical protein